MPRCHRRGLGGKCRRQRRGCARNTGVQYCGSDGGLATGQRDALLASKFQNPTIACVANTTNPFCPVRGSEAVIRRDAVGVSTVVLAMPLPKRDVGRGQNSGFTEPSAKSN